MRTRGWLLTLAVVGVLVTWTAGCGTSRDPTPTAGGGTCRTVTVSIGSFDFNPTPVRVHRCDRVVWKNTHTQAHTSTGQGDQSWSTGVLQPGTTSTPVRFNRAGTFTYVCALHPFMHGEVDVR